MCCSAGVVCLCERPSLQLIAQKIEGLRRPQGASELPRLPEYHRVHSIPSSDLPRPAEHPSNSVGAHSAQIRSGKACQSAAMANGRCRMHGGLSPGAPKGNQNARKHGRYSAEAIQRRRQVVALIRSARKLVAGVEE